MSTKIYNGIRFKTDLPGVHALAMRWREKMEGKTAAMATTYMAARCQTLLDNQALGIKNEVEARYAGQNVASIAWDEFVAGHEAAKRPYARVDYMRDASFSFTVHPVGRSLLGIPFGRAAWIEEFCAEPEVEEYGYWNNTDPPDHLTERQWTAREKTWDKALGHAGIPARAGFVAECDAVLALIMPPKLAEVIKEIAPLEARARKYALRLTVCPEVTPEDIAAGPYTTSKKIEAWRETPVGQMAIAAKLAWCLTKLTEIDEAALQAPFQIEKQP